MSSREAFLALFRAEIAMSGQRQCVLADAVGITEKHLSQMAHGRVGLNLDIVDRILAECGRRLVLATVPDDQVPGAAVPP